MTTNTSDQTINNDNNNDDKPLNWSDAIKSAATDKQANIVDAFAAGWEGMVKGAAEEYGPKVASMGDEALQELIESDPHFKTGIAILDWGGKIATLAPDLAKGGYDARSAVVGLAADLLVTDSVAGLLGTILVGSVALEAAPAIAVGIAAGWMVSKAWEAFSKTDLGHGVVDQLTDPATWAREAKAYEAFGLSMGTAMCNGLEAMQNAAINGAHSVEDYIDAFGTQFMNSLSSVNLAIQKIGEGVKEDHQPLMDAIDYASSYVGDAISAAKDKAVQTGEGIAKTMEDLADDVMDISLPKDILATVMNSAGGAASYIGQAINDMKQVTKNYFDPLIVDIAGGGFNVKSLGTDSPYFDLNQDGVASKNSWVGAGTGFLTQDLNGDGKINDGGDLLTSFDALKVYDTNNDGTISAADTNFSKLGIWQDANQNGVVEAGELKSLGDLGVQSISLATQNSQMAVGDSHLAQISTVTMIDGTTRSIGAADLQTSSVYTKNADGVDVSSDVVALPFLIGYGRVTDLWSAMSTNAALKASVQNLVSIDPANGSAFDNALRDVMFKWVGFPGDANQVNYVNSAGKTVQIYPEVGFLREYLANDMSYRGDVANPVLPTDINTTSAAWSAVFNGIKARILTGMPGTAFSAAFGVDTKTDHVLPREDLATSMSILAQQQPTDPSRNASYWVNAIGIIQNYLLDDKVAWNTVEATLRQYMPSWVSDNIVHQLAVANLYTSIDSNIRAGGPLTGSSYADLFIAAQPNLTLSAGDGANEEFVVLGGMGNTIISSDNRSGAYTNVLYIAKDIDPDSMTVSANAAGALILSIGSGETITLNGMASTSGARYGVQKVVFANGTTMTAADLMAREIASGQGGVADRIYGTAGDDRLDGKGGKIDSDYPSTTNADVSIGNGGNDTFVYKAGYGMLEINQVNSSATPASTLEIDGPMDPASVMLATDTDGNVWMTFGDSTVDMVKLDGMTKMASNGIQSIVFTDSGITWSLDDILTKINSGMGGAGVYNFLDDQTFDTGGGSNLVTSTGSRNVFVYRPGYGPMEINQKATSGLRNSVLAMQSGVLPSQITVSADGSGNIYLNFANGTDSIKLDGMLKDPAAGVGMVMFKDGTVWNYEDIVAMMAIGTDGNDTLFGDAKANTFDGRGGNDTMTGAGGSDTYLFGRGYGQDTIIDVGSTNDKNVVQFLDNVTPADILGARSASNSLDLVLSIAGTTDTLTISNQFKYGPAGYLGTNYGIQLFKFADGTVWSWADIMKLVTIGTAGNETLSGDGTANLFDSKAGDDVMNGGGGGDTFLFGKGYGHDKIYGQGKAGDIETLQFGAGVTLSDIQFSRPSTAVDDLLVTIKSTGDSVQIASQFGGKGTGVTGYGISQFVFADGTTLSYADVLALLATPTDGNDTLYGDGSANTLAGGKGNDTLNGEAGSDTYLFNRGDGQDKIVDAASATGEHDTNTIRFGAGISASDLTITRIGTTNDMLVSVAGGTDTITVTNEFRYEHKYPAQYAGINQFIFADGTVWSYADIERKMTTGGAGNDKLIGDEGDDVVDGGAGNDTLDGGAGNNVYVFGRGYGTDTISETSSSPDAQSSVVKLNADISPSDVYFVDPLDGDTSYTIRMVVKGTSDSLIFVQTHGWTIQFADGTILGYNDIVDSIDQGSAGNDYVFGDARNNTLHGGAGNDNMVGAAGSDTYIFNRGDGQDTISDNATYAPGDVNVLKFGPGIALSDLTFAHVADGAISDRSLLVSINGTTDTVLINSEFGQTNGTPGTTSVNGVQKIVLDDGTVLTYADIYAMFMTGSAATQTLTGTGGNDVYDGKGGGDYYRDAIGGSDTYNVQIGYGKTTIYDSGAIADVDVLNLGAGFTSQNLMISESTSGTNLVLQAVGSDETVAITSEYDTTGKFGVEKIVFSDGTTWTTADIKARTFIGTSGANTLVGTAGNDFINGAAGNDTMTGGNGSDTYQWGKSFGQDVIDNTATDGATATDRVLISGASNDQLWLTKSGNDLKIAIVGTSDTLTLKNWYSDTANQVDEIDLSNGMVLDKSKVDQLVTAMSQFAAPTGSSLNLPANVESALSPTLASTWKPSHAA